MKKVLIVLLSLIVIAMFFAGYVIKKYNRLQQMKVDVENSWAQVENQYQRRYDLIPNLVNTVKGYATHEKDTFTEIAEARSKAGGMVNVDKSILNDPQSFQKFQQVQNNLSGALQRLMVVVERYPELKADKNFMALQDQLEGTENRIAQERRKFNNAVRDFNKEIVTFPNNVFAGIFNIQKAQFFKTKPGAQEAPKVKF